MAENAETDDEGMIRRMVEDITAKARELVETEGPDVARDLRDRLVQESVAGDDWPASKRTAASLMAMALTPC